MMSFVRQYIRSTLGRIGLIATLLLLGGIWRRLRTTLLTTSVLLLRNIPTLLGIALLALLIMLALLHRCPIHRLTLGLLVLTLRLPRRQLLLILLRVVRLLHSLL